VIGLESAKGVAIEEGDDNTLITRGGSTDELSRIDLTTGAISTVASDSPEPRTVAIESNGLSTLVTTSLPTTDFSKGKLLRVEMAFGAVNPIVSKFMQLEEVAIESGGETALMTANTHIYRIRITSEHKRS